MPDVGQTGGNWAVDEPLQADSPARETAAQRARIVVDEDMNYSGKGALGLAGLWQGQRTGILPFPRNADNTADTMQQKPQLRILLSGPRGFCAGVDRAIRVVEEAIRRFGAPVYVRHEIVHNRTVVETLEAQGAVFVEELDEVPADAHVVFSAHGVPKTVPAEAERRNLYYYDATCPLVSKVHREAERHFSEHRHILMIGHAGHPEVVGTMGQLPVGAVTLVQDSDEASVVEPLPGPLAFITQTTLSVDDTAEIVQILRTRFPEIEGPKREDICYATTNRQAAVKAVAPDCDLVIVIGSPNSSNSQRLREVAERAGAKKAVLVPRARDLDWSLMDGVQTLGLTAGASAPELLVQEMLTALAERYTLGIEERRVTDEDVIFKLPAPLS
jgi:4-hydroxy-3-methylbut-2-enyl diphosphate reductase